MRPAKIATRPAPTATAIPTGVTRIRTSTNRSPPPTRVTTNATGREEDAVHHPAGEQRQRDHADQDDTAEPGDLRHLLVVLLRPHRIPHVPIARSISGASAWTVLPTSDSNPSEAGAVPHERRHPQRTTIPH